jgi:hypothetical protein
MAFRQELRLFCGKYLKPGEKQRKGWNFRMTIRFCIFKG